MSPRERLFALERFGIKLGLDNINQLLSALGRPEHAWQAVHVGGTNGKGSVSAMLERGFRSAGDKTGRYTSPHLNAIEERIAIDGRSIDAGLFDDIASDVLGTVDRLREDGLLPGWPTFFEVTTAIAFEAFKRSGVTLAVVEVGLGGRFDATNVLMPMASVITSIALDHERHLGTTLGQIAFEKAGIIKPATPVVVGALPPAARDVIVSRAQTLRAPLIEAGQDHIQHVRLERGRATIVLQTPTALYPEVTLALNGAHQIGNAVIAALTLELCAEQGLPIGPTDVTTALSDVEWPARLEWLSLGDKQILIDAAHNPAGMQALATYLRAADVAPLPLVIAVMQDKDVENMLRAIAPAISHFIATEVATGRCIPAPDLAARISQLMPASEVTTSADTDCAMALALRSSHRAVVAGSMFLVGPARARLVERGALPTPLPS